MAEEKVTHHLIALGRGYNGFFCPETRFHLMGGVKPQDFYPADTPLSKAIKVGLRSGTLRDVNGTIPVEEIYAGIQAGQAGPTKQKVIVAKPISGTVEVTAGSDSAPNGNDSVSTEGKTDDLDWDDDNEGNSNDETAKAKGEKLSEEEIDSATKKALLAYIKENEIDMETLSINAKSDLDEIRDALKVHFGYKMV